MARSKGFCSVTYNFFTLSFTGEDKHLESAYRAYDFKKSLLRVRAAILVAVFFYAVFGILDAIIAPDNKHLFWFIRYGLVIPFALWVLWYSFQPGFKARIQPVLFTMCLSGGLGIVSMVILADPPAAYSYYAGIILIFITIFTFLRLRFMWAVSCSWLIVISYEIGAVLIVDTPATVLINNNFFFISANIFCMFAGYSIELNSRKRYMSKLRLEQAKTELEQANTELDRRVLERTNQLLEETLKLETEIKEREISEKKNQDLRNQLLQAQKMEAIGTLAGGIAHDFNNILTSILGFTELALEEVEEDSSMEDGLREIYAGGNRAKELVKQILTFARQSEEEIKPIQIGPVMSEVIKLIRSSIPATIEIRASIETEAMIMGNPTQIYQVLMNLCTNAFHAMEADGGVLTLTLKNHDPVSGPPLPAGALKDKAYIELEISDTGIGIKPENLGLIFDPYYTTKTVGKGTGMGLSVIHGIVTSYRGKIRVRSTPGKGSRFTIFLPVTNQTEEKAGFYENADLPRGAETLLFIDDEIAITKMADETLSRLGYTVITETDSLNALERFKQTPTAFDLVLSDMTMPRMTGNVLATHMLQIRPDIPIILCTGYSPIATEEDVIKSGVKALLNKPIIKRDLAMTVRNVIDAGTVY